MEETLTHSFYKPNLKLNITNQSISGSVEKSFHEKSGPFPFSKGMSSPMNITNNPFQSDYRVRALNKIRLHNEITLNFGVPDSFALMQDRFVAI